MYLYCIILFYIMYTVLSRFIIYLYYFLLYLFSVYTDLKCIYTVLNKISAVRERRPLRQRDVR